jgi:pentatricopeptide repeat protein
MEWLGDVFLSLSISLLTRKSHKHRSLFNVCLTLITWQECKFLKDGKRALALLAELRGHGMTPVEMDYASAMGALARQNMTPTAIELFETMQQEGITPRSAFSLPHHIRLSRSTTTPGRT